MNVRTRCAFVTAQQRHRPRAVHALRSRGRRHEWCSRDLHQEACQRAAPALEAYPVAADRRHEDDIRHCGRTIERRLRRIDLSSPTPEIAIDGYPGMRHSDRGGCAEDHRHQLFFFFMSESGAKYAIRTTWLEQGGGYLLNTASAAGHAVILDNRVLHGHQAHAASVSRVCWRPFIREGTRGIGVAARTRRQC